MKGQLGSNMLGGQGRTGHFHAVRFYDDARSLAQIVAEFLGEGLAKGDAAVVIATPEHRVFVEENLRSRSIDVDELTRLGQLVALDARETLNQFMADGMPNGALFKRVVGHVLDQVCKAKADCTIRAYGEMVNVLWKDGHEAAAIRLEMLWNELANTRDFKLLCGYSMGNFYKGAAIDEIKAQHSRVVADASPSIAPVTH